MLPTEVMATMEHGSPSWSAEGAGSRRGEQISQPVDECVLECMLVWEKGGCGHMSGWQVEVGLCPPQDGVGRVKGREGMDT